MCSVSMATPEHPYSVAIFFPKKLSNNPILKRNMKNLRIYFDDYLRVAEQLSFVEKTMEILYISSEISNQNRMICTLQEKLKENEKNMNSGIDPYKWEIVKGIDTFVGSINVKADYALFLE